MVRRILELIAVLGMLVFILSLAGCGGPDKAAIETVTMSPEYYRVNNINTGQYDEFHVVVIDGCQYFYQYGAHGGSTLCHKGNCTNPIHQYNRGAEKP